MPVDLSKPQPDRRKVSREATAGLRQDGMYSREIEMKRNRGEISCAECRRLKIKCDKQIPCQFVIAATEHLHRRIDRMGDRIRELEDALAGSLLVDTEKPEEQPQESEDEGADEITKSLGTLTVSDHGISRFFGFTGGSDLLLLENDDSAGSPSQTTESDSSRSSLPLHLQRFSESFPFTPTGTVKQNIDTIRDYLPPWDLALAMAESYLANATWIFRSITRQQLINEMLPAIYGKQTVYADDYSGPHDLALLFSVFALGSVVDVSLPNSTSESEGEHYKQLALAALCQQPVLVKPSVVTIQTLHISAVYSAMLGGDVSGGETTLESTWSLVAIACYLAQTVHRDPARWESDPRIVQRRRLVFWDLFLADSWNALITGRPPSFNRAFVDCKFPQEGDVPANLDPGEVSSLGAWMFRFGFEGPAEIVARTLTSAPPRYSTIQELDRKVHEFRVPPETLQAMRGGPGVDPRSVPVPASMTAFLLSNIQDVLLLYLHRNFFIQALIEDPEDPIRSQYAPSFLTTVRASKNILRTIEEQLPIQPVIFSRFWTIWTFTFSAAVVFAFIATHGPRSPLANDAIIELDRAYTLIEVASQTNYRAKRALVILNRMREKAHRALEAVRDTPQPPQPDGAVHSVKQEEIEDDFVVFAGRSRVFRPGGNVTPAPQVVPTQQQDPTHQHDRVPPHDEHAAAGDPLATTRITSRRSIPHLPHRTTRTSTTNTNTTSTDIHPEQPQYTLEAVPPPSHYVTDPYIAYAPPSHPQASYPQQALYPHPHPHNLHPSSHASGIGQPPQHGLHTDEEAEMQREYA
ncbi:hypothetical protein H4582DRAFT_1940839, partial [Lactarius indigo]